MVLKNRFYANFEHFLKSKLSETIFFLEIIVDSLGIFPENLVVLKLKFEDWPSLKNLHSYI